MKVIFRRHTEKKKEKFYKISETQLKAIKYLLIEAQCSKIGKMRAEAVDILDRIKCGKADEIDWEENAKRFLKEEESIKRYLDAVIDIIERD